MQKCMPTKGKPWPLSPHDTQILVYVYINISLLLKLPLTEMHPVEPIPHSLFLVFLLHFQNPTILSEMQNN